MTKAGSLISRYLVTSILPYFAAAWLLLTVILFVQQAGRYSDIFFGINIPGSLAWQLTLALVPNVIAFTCPMAILVGTIIGLSKMQGDSELVAIRASGVGNLQIALPIMMLGVLLSGFAFLVNLEGVPLAAGIVRRVAMQTALKKLESPIEPGVFNSEVAGYTIYVKDGDIETGRWKNIFIYSEDRANESIRLVTSGEGRIDTEGANSELVLENAIVTTLPMRAGQGKYVSENLGGIRLAIRTPRSELLGKLTSSQLSIEELGIQQLSEYASTLQGREKVEAQILQNRRLLLSITPFIFCLLGTVIVLRLNRGGRNFGIALALIVLIFYYVLAFLGEQLARTGNLSVLAASLMPLAGSFLVIVWFSVSRRLDFWSGVADRVAAWAKALLPTGRRPQLRNIFVDVTTGIRDFDVITTLVKNFLLTIVFLSLIFVIFTGFELWKYAGAFPGGVNLLFKYLFYLTPLVYLQVAAPAAMIAVLATYAIKSRQNEIVTWTSAGQSIYRLLLPCFLLMLLIGAINWTVQEYVLPGANQVQDDLRVLIRNRGVPIKPPDKSWIATEKRIYAFKPSDAASDNERRSARTDSGTIRDVSIYEFAPSGNTLQTAYRSSEGLWKAGEVVLSGAVEVNDLRSGRVRSSIVQEQRLSEDHNPFADTQLRASQVNTKALRGRVDAAESESDRRDLELVINRRYSTVFLPLLMALFTAPFAISLSRKGKAASIGAAVAVWLVFSGAANIFEQLGSNGLLPPAIAIWSPIVIFALLGAYLISRART